MSNETWNNTWAMLYGLQNFCYIVSDTGDFMSLAMCEVTCTPSRNVIFPYPQNIQVLQRNTEVRNQIHYEQA